MSQSKTTKKLNIQEKGADCILAGVTKIISQLKRLYHEGLIVPCTIKTSAEINTIGNIYHVIHMNFGLNIELPCLHRRICQMPSSRLNVMLK